MNKVILIGRMTKDPETRYTQSGTAVATFTLAVDRRFNKEGQPSADFVPCVAWNKLAEVIANNLAKGRKVGIEGRLQVRSYDAQDGSKRYVTEVIVDELDFCDSKKQGSGLPAAPDITEEIPF
jgi:single-strand DNA-binding protein